MHLIYRTYFLSDLAVLAKPRLMQSGRRERLRQL
jgi:hypothetical protein